MELDLENQLNTVIDVIKINKNTDKFLLKNIVNDCHVIYSRSNSFEKLYSFVEEFFIVNADFIHFREVDLLDQ